MLRSRDGKSYPRERVPGPENCSSCGNAFGHYHDPGCDMEPCPQCTKQLTSCDCLYAEATYQVFDDVNPLEDACRFALDKDVISISTQGIYKTVMVTVFYWR